MTESELPATVHPAHQGNGNDDYGSGYSLHRLVEGMKMYKVPGLKLPKV